jgi:hypothetical protein
MVCLSSPRLPGRKHTLSCRESCRKPACIVNDVYGASFFFFFFALFFTRPGGHESNWAVLEQWEFAREDTCNSPRVYDGKTD